MKHAITLTHNDERRILTSFGDYAAAEGECPKCGATPFHVQGAGMRIAPDDRAYESDGYCARCRAPVGLIRAKVSTLFGLHEDEAVLGGRARVY